VYEKHSCVKYIPTSFKGWPWALLIIIVKQSNGKMKMFNLKQIVWWYCISASPGVLTGSSFALCVMILTSFVFFFTFLTWSLVPLHHFRGWFPLRNEWFWC
jgi:hypothetical protein